MTKKDIIRMAREAGGADISSHVWTSWVGTQSTEFLERFAKLVAGVEREEILQMSRDKWFKTQADFEAAIAARWKHD